MPAIRTAGASESAPTPDTPFQGAFKPSLGTLRPFPTAGAPERGYPALGPMLWNPYRGQGPLLR